MAGLRAVEDIETGQRRSAQPHNAQRANSVCRAPVIDRNKVKTEGKSTGINNCNPGADVSTVYVVPLSAHGRP